MTDRTGIEADFENSLREAARICTREFNYRPNYFLSMLNERGGVATAKALLAKPTPSEGFVKLVVDYQRPELTVESIVSEPRFQSLFDESEIAKARRWLGRN